LDSAGNLVAMTIEHAKKQANLPYLSYEQIEKKLPNKTLQQTAKSRQ
jgi:ubiquitin